MGRAIQTKSNQEDSNESPFVCALEKLFCNAISLFSLQKSPASFPFKKVPSIFKKCYFFNVQFTLMTSAWKFHFHLYYKNIFLSILHCLFYRKDSYCLFHLKMGKGRLNNLLATNWDRS